VDETCLKVDGRWCYVYRAIDGTGALADALFSERRDMRAAKAFFRSAKAVTGITPDRVTTDGHDSYPRAIRTELGRGVRHRTSRYLGSRHRTGRIARLAARTGNMFMRRLIVAVSCEAV
jgi:putative transposase